MQGHCDTLIVMKATHPKSLALTLEIPILEWHMVAWLVVKNGHQIYNCYNESRLFANNKHHFSIKVNAIQRKRIFIFT